MIREVYQGKPIEIICIPDRPSISNDSSWGIYVMEHLANYGFFPDAVYQGIETERKSWWYVYPGISVENVSRIDIPISATLIRAAIIEKRVDFIKEHCPFSIAEYIVNSIYWGRDFHD